ncbi:hypothetical protein DLB08_00610 [Salmonella enterica subsp. enterica]|nr:hypothetical protein [Salmonella enterica subsp. enterica serovar Infantis]
MVIILTLNGEQQSEQLPSGQYADITLENNGIHVFKAQALHLGDIFGARQRAGIPFVNKGTQIIECVLILYMPIKTHCK